MGSGAVSIVGGIAVKQMDEGAVHAFMLTGLCVTGLKAIKQLIELRKEKTPGYKDGGPTEEALGTMSSMAWMISESTISALMIRQG